MSPHSKTPTTFYGLLSFKIELQPQIPLHPAIKDSHCFINIMAQPSHIYEHSLFSSENPIHYNQLHLQTPPPSPGETKQEENTLYLFASRKSRIITTPFCNGRWSSPSPVVPSQPFLTPYISSLWPNILFKLLYNLSNQHKLLMFERIVWHVPLKF